MTTSVIYNQVRLANEQISIAIENAKSRLNEISEQETNRDLQKEMILLTSEIESLKAIQNQLSIMR